MPRRKNSAEMLDVLRRLSQDEKARRARQIQKANGPADQEERGLPGGLAEEAPARGAPARGTGRGFLSWLARTEESRKSPPSRLGATDADGEDGLERGDRGAAPLRIESVLAPAPSRIDRGVADPAPEPVALVAVEAVPLAEGSLAEAVAAPVQGEELAVPDSPPRPAQGKKGRKGRGGGKGKSGRKSQKIESITLPAETPARVPEVETPMPAVPSSVEVPAPEATPAWEAVTTDAPLPDVAGSTIEPAPEIPPETSPGEAAPTGREEEEEETPARRPLFGRRAEGGGPYRPLLARLIGTAVAANWAVSRRKRDTDAPGGFRQRLPARLAALGLYGAVAAAAMLVVALFISRTGGHRSNEKLLEEHEASAVEGRGQAIPLENVPPGPGIAPEVRNVIATPQPGPQEKAASAGPTAHPPASGLVVGDKGPPGFYVQIQSLVFPEHAKLIVGHLQALGYASIWQRPMVQRPGIPTSFIIRLGPYPTEEAANAAMKEFTEKIKKNPLKKPRLDWSSLFVFRHQVPSATNPLKASR